MTKKRETPPTVITLTLPSEGGIQRTGTLLIQRGDLARLFQFHYCNAGDITSAIKDATKKLVELEQAPPVITDESAPTEKAPKTEIAAAEPTVDLPTKSGNVAVKIGCLKIIGGETDAAAYRKATLIGARLINAKLWDGKTPIHIEDAHATYARIKDMDDAALGASTLSDLVKLPDTPAQSDDDPEDDSDANADPLAVDGDNDDDENEPIATNLPPTGDEPQQLTIF